MKLDFWVWDWLYLGMEQGLYIFKFYQILFDLEIFISNKQRKNPEPCRILYEKEKNCVRIYKLLGIFLIGFFKMMMQMM